MSNLLYYGVSNGTGIIFCVIFSIVCIRKYRNKSYTDRLKPLKLLSWILIPLELIKIIYHITVQGHFPPQRYPIVFCSLIMYTYPIICHTKENSLASRISKGLSIYPSLVIGILYVFIMPSVTNPSTYSFMMNWHSRFYHFCMLAGAIYIIAVKLYDYRFKDFFACGITAGLYFVFCTILSLAIGGDISYFGPTSAPTQFLYKSFGYTVGNILMIFISVLLGFICYYITNLFINIYHRNKNEKKDLL